MIPWNSIPLKVPWKPIPEALTPAISKYIVLDTCTRSPIKGEVFVIAGGYWESITSTEIVCLGVHSCNTYWFRRVGLWGPEANETVYIKDWENMIELGVARWVRYDEEALMR